MKRIIVLSVVTCLVATVRGMETWAQALAADATGPGLACLGLDLLLAVLAFGCSAVSLSLVHELRMRRAASRALCEQLAERYGMELDPGVDVHRPDPVTGEAPVQPREEVVPAPHARPAPIWRRAWRSAAPREMVALSDR